MNFKGKDMNKIIVFIFLISCLCLKPANNAYSQYGCPDGYSGWPDYIYVGPDCQINFTYCWKCDSNEIKVLILENSVFVVGNADCKAQIFNNWNYYHHLMLMQALYMASASCSLPPCHGGQSFIYGEVSDATCMKIHNNTNQTSNVIPCQSAKCKLFYKICYNGYDRIITFDHWETEGSGTCDKRLDQILIPPLGYTFDMEWETECVQLSCDQNY